MSKAVDITGKRFGMLVAMVPMGKKKNGNIVWKCKCDCGKETKVSESDLVREHIISCGCAHGIHDGTMDCRLNNKLSINNKTGVRGVTFCRGRFKAYIRYKGKLHHLGYFYTLKDAKEARKIAEKEIWGKDLE